MNETKYDSVPGRKQDNIFEFTQVVDGKEFVSFVIAIRNFINLYPHIGP